MSEAFDRAMKEIDRVWDASDKFDTKVLQFIGIITAGALAATAIVVDKLHIATPFLTPAVVLLIAGAAGFLFFMALALSSAIGFSFAGPLDPRALAEYPPYLKDDDEFQKDMLPVIAATFDECVNSQERKWRRFAWSLRSLIFAILCLSAAVTMCLVTSGQ